MLDDPKNRRAPGEARTPLTLLRIRAEREHRAEPTCSNCSQYSPPPRSAAGHPVLWCVGRCRLNDGPQAPQGVCLRWEHSS